MPDDGFLLCYVMCVLPDRLPAWGPFPFLRPSLLLRPLRVVIVSVGVVGTSVKNTVALPEVVLSGYITGVTPALGSNGTFGSSSTGVYATPPVW